MSIHWLPRVDLVRLILLGCLFVLRYSSFKLGSPKLVTSLIPGQWNDTYLTENCSFHVCQTVCKTDFYSTNKNFKAVCKHSEIIMYHILLLPQKWRAEIFISSVCLPYISVSSSATSLLGCILFQMYLNTYLAACGTMQLNPFRHGFSRVS